VALRFLHLVRHGEAGEVGLLTSSGREQARLAGQRLAALPISAIFHSPQPRAEETATIIAAYLPEAEVHRSGLVDDYVPAVPDMGALPAAYRSFLAWTTPAQRETGSALAAAAIDRYAHPAPFDTHELIITHNFQIAWFVRDALGAPPERWLGLNQANCALTTILYRADRPPVLVRFNDQSHLPAELQWTGFPEELRT